MFAEGFCKGLHALLAGSDALMDALHLNHLHSDCTACLYKSALCHMMCPS